MTIIIILFVLMQWVGTKQDEFQVNSMQLLYYQVSIINDILKLEVSTYCTVYIVHVHV